MSGLFEATGVVDTAFDFCATLFATGGVAAVVAARATC
jgi:hypothetical protein